MHKLNYILMCLKYIEYIGILPIATSNKGIATNTPDTYFSDMSC